MSKTIEALKKLSLNYYIALILSLLILLFACFAPFKIARNVTDSLPHKFFLVFEGKLPKKDDYVAFKNDNTKKFYDYPFIKQVIGVEGDEVIEFHNDFWIMSSQYLFLTSAGKAKEFSLKGEKLTKNTVRIIPSDYYYVYAPHKDSLDSRYKDIGLIHKKDIIGKARPLTSTDLVSFISILFCLFLLIKLISFYAGKSVKIIITALILFNITPVYSKDLGVHSQTIYNIIETDLSQDIKNKLTALEESGELERLQQQQQKQAIQRAERPKSAIELPRAIKTVETLYDPSITANKDFYDHQGNIIVAKGTTANPLHYQNLPQRLLFINGDDKSQVNWAVNKAKEKPSLIILTKGNIMQLMRDLKIRLYFDQNAAIINSFSEEVIINNEIKKVPIIKHLPAEVFQEKDLLKIREVAI